MNNFDKFMKDLRAYEAKIFKLLPIELKADVLLAQHDKYMAHSHRAAKLRDSLNSRKYK